MDYIQQAYKGIHEWIYYLVGLFIIFIAWPIIGGVPLGVAIFINAIDANNVSMDIANMSESLGKNLFLFLMLFTFAMGLIALFFVNKYLHKQTLKNLTTARQKVDWKRFWFMFILWGTLSISLVMIDYYTFPEHYEINYKLIPFLILSIIAIVMIPLQTSFEEYLFRGYLMQGIGVTAKNKWLPLILTSVGFGLLHGANPEIEKLGWTLMIYYIGTGFFLGVMTLMDDGLELALGFHAANNLFTALLITSDWSAFQTHSILKDINEPEKIGFLEVLMPLFLMFILTIILSKKYKWNNWKEKLFGPVTPPTNIESEINTIGES